MALLVVLGPASALLEHFRKVERFGGVPSRFRTPWQKCAEALPKCPTQTTACSEGHGMFMFKIHASLCWALLECISESKSGSSCPG